MTDTSNPAETRVTEPAVGLAEDGAHVLISRFALHVKVGPDLERAFCSRGERTVIGTDPSTDVTLGDGTVSRFHAEIVLSPRGAVLRDLGSLNGTWANGLRIRECHLRDGAMFSVGNTRLRFQTSAESMPLAVSLHERFGSMVGRLTAMRRLFAILGRAAASDCTVLIDGETGTGKEATAESIHRQSARAKGPFVVVDCSAIPKGLLESELFGHTRGAFTGAVTARVGAFQAARGGTIFLDEIGELGPDLQPKLLRVIEEREFRRVGSNDVVPVNVRVIAATNRNLEAEVNTQKFRSDLFFRLAVIQARLPPLRERCEDISLLIENILERVGAGESEVAARLRGPELQAELMRHSWPGNVRELRNYVERCLALGECPPIERDYADEAVGTWPLADQPIREARETWLRRFERRYLEALIRSANDNISHAARLAGIDRAHLYRLLKRHGMR